MNGMVPIPFTELKYSTDTELPQELINYPLKCCQEIIVII